MTLNTAGNQMAGAIGSTGTGAVTLVNGIATQLGAIGASGVGNAAASLSVTTSNDAVTQSADAFVAGATVVNAGTADITLARPGNDFQGTVSLTGGALSVRDANDLNIIVLVNGGDQVDHRHRRGHADPAGGGLDAERRRLDLRSLGGTLTTPGALTAGEPRR